MYKHNLTASVRGGLASGVPGDLKGLEYLHNKYGVSASEQRISIKLMFVGFAMESGGPSVCIYC